MKYYPETLKDLRLLKRSVQPSVAWTRHNRSLLAADIASRPLPRAASCGWALPHWATLGAVAVLVFAVVSTGVGLAAQNEIPGGRLYGVKLFLEEVQVTLTPSTPDRVRVVLQQASRRLAEAKQATEANQQPAAKLALAHYEAKVAVATSQLTALENSGSVSEIKDAATVATTTTQAHQEQLKDLGETTEPEPESLAVLIGAEKVAVATEAVAEKLLIQKDLDETNDQDLDDVKTLPAGTDADELAPLETDKPKIGAAPAVTPTPELTPAFLAARARAVERLGIANGRANKFAATLFANKDKIDPQVLVTLNKQLKNIGDTLAKAEQALAKNDLMGSLESSTLASVIVIDAEAALKLALPKPVKALEPVPTQDVKDVQDVGDVENVEDVQNDGVKNDGAIGSPSPAPEVKTPPKDAGTGTASLSPMENRT